MKSVSVITVNYNHSHVTESLLESIFSLNTYPLEIIVVDNGSKDNPVPWWRSKYDSVSVDIKFIRSEINLGFAGGNNLGIMEAKGDYLFFVNNDTEFTEGLVEKLVATLDSDPNIGMVSPKIRYYDKPDMLQYAGFTKMNYYTCRNSCIGLYETDHGQYDKLTGETGYTHGAAMMVRAEAVKKAGMMPEIYFLYYEEMDWCEMIRRAGYTIHINMQALIYHKESVSVGAKSSLKEYYMNRNRILFVRRNSPLPAKLFFWPYFLFVVTPRNILSYFNNGHKGFTSLLLQAIAWNLANDSDGTPVHKPHEI